MILGIEKSSNKHHYGFSSNAHLTVSAATIAGPTRGWALQALSAGLSGARALLRLPAMPPRTAG